MKSLLKLDNVRLSIIFLILANIIWGASFPIYKWTLQEVPPFTFMFLRFSLAALILLPFVFKKFQIAREDYKNLIVFSLIAISLQITLITLGLELTPSINAPIIIATGPIILIIASFLFLKEKPTLKLISGTLISLLGVLAIILLPLLENGLTGGVLGNLLIFGATICFVIQAILLKKLTVRNNPLAITFWMFLIGVIPFIPFVLWESQTFNIATDMSMNGLFGIIYGVIFSAVIAHYFYAYGVSHIKASEVGIFSYVDPLATIAVAIPLLDETISVTYVIGAMLVFLGIFIAEGRIHYHPLNRLVTNHNTI